MSEIEKEVQGRKQYPLMIPENIWNQFIAIRDKRYPHLPVNGVLVEAIIEYVAAHESVDARETAEGGAK